MNIEYAVQLKNVSKIYILKKRDKTKIKHQFYALKDITFSVEKGDIVGILGTNGSGKSTLSSILSEISSPDEGTVKINGEQALIAINTGLNNHLTGLENIKLKGTLLGLSKKDIERITVGVMEFSELGDFLYQPVKNYSSGMKSRLGFSISICLNPDIIIIDEALSVGDKAFADKCINKFEEFKNQGKTIFFISHSLPQIKSFCTKGLWIEGGRLKAYGPIEEVALAYSQYVEDFKKLNDIEKKEYRQNVLESRIIEKKHKNIKTQVKNVLEKCGRRLYIGIVLFLVVILGLITLYIYPFGTGESKQKENDIGEVGAIQKELYNFIFLLEGPDVNFYKDSYRAYLDNYQGSTILDIVNIQISPGDGVKLTRIPASLQVYYNELDIYDEIKFLYLLESNQQEILQQLSQIVNSEIDNVFMVSKDVLLDIMKELDISLIMNDDTYVWQIADSNYQIDYSSYDEEVNQSYLNMFKSVFNRFKSLNLEKQKLLFSQLTTNACINSEYELDLNSLITNNLLEVSMDSLQSTSKLVSELIDENYYSQIGDSAILDKRLLALDELSLSKNIYVSTLSNNIELYIREEEEEDEDELDAGLSEEDVSNSNNRDLNDENDYVTEVKGNSSGYENSGETPPGNSSGETPSDNNSGGTPPGNSSGETPSDNNSGGTSPGNSSGETPSDNNSGETSPGNSSGETPSDNNSGETSPGNSSGETPSDNNSGEISPGNSSSEIPSESSSGGTPLENNSSETLLQSSIEANLL